MEWWWAAGSLVAVFALVVLAIWQKFGPKPDYEGAPPRVYTRLPFVGPALSFWWDANDFLNWAYDNFGPVFRVNLLLVDATVLIDTGSTGGGGRGGRYYRIFFESEENEISFFQAMQPLVRPLLSSSSSAPPLSRLQECHRLLVLALSSSASSMMERWTQNALRLARSRFEEWSQQQKPLQDLHAGLEGLAADINVANFMGESFGRSKGHHWTRLMVQLQQNAGSWSALLLPGLPFPAIQRCKRTRAALHDMLEAELQKRRNNQPAEDADLLQLLIDSGASTEAILDVQISLFITSHHNLANLLTWLAASLFLPKNKQPLQKALEEQEAQPAEFIYLNQCIKEVIRSYSSLTVYPRKVIKPFRVDLATIAKDSYVLVTPYIHHQDKNIYPQPERFYPERFDPARGASPYGNQFTYFGFGPHACKGAGYTLAVSKACIGLLLREYKVELSGRNEELPDPKFARWVGLASPSAALLATISRR
ncbi:hypothetical protein QOT17_014292 [Balamuthia mandrillaris]